MIPCTKLLPTCGVQYDTRLETWRCRNIQGIPHDEDDENNKTVHVLLSFGLDPGACHGWIRNWAVTILQYVPSRSINNELGNSKDSKENGYCRTITLQSNMLYVFQL